MGAEFFPIVHYPQAMNCFPQGVHWMPYLRRCVLGRRDDTTCVQEDGTMRDGAATALLALNENFSLTTSILNGRNKKRRHGIR